jgi:hypothetical protein
MGPKPIFDLMVRRKKQASSSTKIFILIVHSITCDVYGLGYHGSKTLANVATHYPLHAPFKYILIMWSSGPDIT